MHGVYLAVFCALLACGCLGVRPLAVALHDSTAGVNSSFTTELPTSCCLLEYVPGGASQVKCETRRKLFQAAAASSVILSFGFFLLCIPRVCLSNGTATPMEKKLRSPKAVHRDLHSVKKAASNWTKHVVDVEVDKNKLHHEHAKLLADAGAKYSDSIGGALGPEDVLLIVDMQNDFLPQDVAPLGGRFGVAEGGIAADVIVQLIKKAASAKAKIVATRDYHPKNHCSFDTNGGHFPPHCVQGHVGSFFFEPIEKALKQAKADGADVSVVFKGFCQSVDSFGGFTYSKEYFEDRHLGDPDLHVHDCCALHWTGCFFLSCSNIDEDLNAPPDVCAVFERETLKDRLGSIGRLFGTGLALDFCVMDSLLNASGAGVADKGTFLVADAARAAYIPGIGEYGTGFLSNPIELVQKMSEGNVQLVNSDLLLA